MYWPVRVSCLRTPGDPVPQEPPVHSYAMRFRQDPLQSVLAPRVPLILVLMPRDRRQHRMPRLKSLEGQQLACLVWWRLSLAAVSTVAPLLTVMAVMLLKRYE